MDNDQNEKIRKLRMDGCSYTLIAEMLEISENTVKSFCRRNRLGGATTVLPEQLETILCRACGARLIHIPGKKKKQFCSDKCRMLYWGRHSEQLKRKTISTFTCVTCGRQFESHGSRERKYCSRACYGKSRTVKS